MDGTTLKTKCVVSPVTACLAASVFAVLAGAANAAQTVTDWDLPAQPLADSLRAVAAGSDSNILFDRKLVAGQAARPLKTQASADEALTQLLEGTGLTYRHVDDKTVTIQLAQAQPARTPVRIQRRGTASSDTPVRLGQIEEIVVTGTNIRGIENNTAPLTVLNRDYIESTGFSTTVQLIESLPQNFALANQSVVNSSSVSLSREQGAAINLRAIGEGTTLVLMNGRRLAAGFQSAAVDISALPLTAIERVEVLPDGASALYGSDAVGGVVNFILRDDFEGVETRIRSGYADGTDELRIGQTLGGAWSSGNALLSLEYYQRDLLLASDRDFIPSNSVVGSLLPDDENYSAVFTGQQQITPSVSVFADALYTQRDSKNQGGRLILNERATVDNPQVFGNVGVNWQLGGSWQIDAIGSYSSNDLNVVRTGLTQFLTPSNSTFDSKFETQSAQLKLDGTLLNLPGGEMRMAIGADWRSDSYEDTNRSDDFGIVLRSTDSDQIVRSGFMEVYVPVIGEPNAMTGARSLEVSLAGRYDDYSTFGSSFDPQYGLMYEPLSGLRLRARYGTSYKAPNLVEYNLSGNIGAAISDLDPTVPAGLSYQLQISGIDVASLRAQESESSSFGVEFAPESVLGLSMSANYYNIRYRNRIASLPVPQVMYMNPAAYSGLFIRNPTPAQVNQFIAIAQLGTGFFAFDPATFQPIDPASFDPTTVNVIVDTRRRNLSVVDTKGVDFSTRYELGLGSGRLALGLEATYILDLEQQVTATSTSVDIVNTFNNPPDLRLRSNIGWQQAGWVANLFVNYSDSYTDNRAAAPVPIDSYTTIDARLAYSFSNRFSSGFLSGVTVAASVQNLADEDPPGTAVFMPPPPGVTFDTGYDATNANPLGRFMALELTKSW